MELTILQCTYTAFTAFTRGSCFNWTLGRKHHRLKTATKTMHFDDDDGVNIAPLIIHNKSITTYFLRSPFRTTLQFFQRHSKPQICLFLTFTFPHIFFYYFLFCFSLSALAMIPSCLFALLPSMRLDENSLPQIYSFSFCGCCCCCSCCFFLLFVFFFLSFVILIRIEFEYDVLIKACVSQYIFVYSSFHSDPHPHTPTKKIRTKMLNRLSVR